MGRIAHDPGTIETLGPPGILPAEGVYEPVHEAEAIVEALRKLLHRRNG